jgi:hypothetical protein
MRHIPIAIATMVIALAVLWWAIWAISSAQFREFVDDWIAAHRTAGYQVRYDSREMGGFPRRITMHFTNFVLENSVGIRVHSDNIDLSTLPWRWHHLNAKTTHGFDLTIPFADTKILTITANAAKSRIDLDKNSDWRSLQLEVKDGKAIWADKPFFGGDRLEVSLSRPDQEPKDHTEAGLTLSAGADNLTLPPDLVAPFGSKLKHIDIAVRVMGAVPDPRKKPSVAAWNSANGLLAFDQLDIDWGPLLFTTHGTLGLDDDLQPEGAFMGQIGNHKAVLKALMDEGEIPKHDEGMLDSALNLFTKPVTVDGTAGIEAPITVQLDGLFLGPVRVFEFSPIQWDEETTPVPLSTPPQDVTTPPAP